MIARFALASSPAMKTLRLVTLAVLAVAATQIGMAEESRASERRAERPDTYVADWDAVASEAFSASGLTAAEGHVIFAYQAIGSTTR